MVHWIFVEKWLICYGFLLFSKVCCFFLMLPFRILLNVIYSGILMYQFFHGTVHVSCLERLYRVLHQMAFFVSMILFKLLRLLVPYLTILLLLKISTEYFEEVSVVEIPSNDHTCAETMWRNILFIDIFLPLDQRVRRCNNF